MGKHTRADEQAYLESLPRFGKSFISTDGQQRINDLIETGHSRAMAAIIACADEALRTALFRKPSGARWTIPQLVEYLRPHFPPDVQLTPIHQGLEIRVPEETNPHVIWTNWQDVLTTQELYALQPVEENDDDGNPNSEYYAGKRRPQPTYSMLGDDDLDTDQPF